jgi:hypothetical protein
MTEAEWLSCTDPEALLGCVKGGASERRLRLFACACVRAAWPWTGEPDHPAVAAAERFADGQEDADGLLGVRNAPWSPHTFGARFGPAKAIVVRAAATATTSPAAWSAARNAADASARIEGAPPEYPQGQCDLLRDIIASPYRPAAVCPACLTPQVVGLARAAYDRRHLPSGELVPARLAVLADALEEAGCDQADLLGHLRGPGPHVRGCWAVDLVLGKE